MNFSTPRKLPRRQEEGIALVIVLLFTAIVLSIVVSTTATLALGARGGGANERAAYQALLAAESGQNTFAIRYLTALNSLPPEQQYRRDIENTDGASLGTWMQANGLVAYSPAPEASVSLTLEGSGGRLTLRTTGSTAGGARKEVLQDYRAIQLPAFGGAFGAPLTSYANVNVKANAQVTGESGATSTGMVAVARVSQAGGVTLPASVDAPSATLHLSPTLGTTLLLGAGDYVQVGASSLTYRVTAVQGTQVTLSSLTGNTPAITITDTSEVRRIDSAVAQAFVQTSSASSEIRVSDPSFFDVGSTVYVGTLPGQVTATDPVNRRISVQWAPTASASTSTIPEGTPVRQEAQSVVSGYEVSGDLNNVPNGESENDLRMRDLNPFNPAADTPATDLFTHTFDQTKDQLLAAPPYHGWLTPEPSPFPGDVSGPTFYNGDLVLSGSQRLCGSGILIVRGNLTVNDTCTEGFRGLIYVIGDYDQQGNSVIRGSVIAEGSQQNVDGTECVAVPPAEGSGSGPSNSCDTQIAGTGNGSGSGRTGKIIYDRGALLEAGSQLAPPLLQPVPGTWRQR